MLMSVSTVVGLIMFCGILSWNFIQMVLFFLVLLLFLYMKDYTMMSENLGLLGGDSMSFMLVSLSVWITSLMFMGGGLEEKGENYKEFKLLCLLILLFLWMSFISIDLLMFYIFFELVLIPMFLLIMAFGYQPERLESSIYMLFYTMFGSLPLLVGILQLKNTIGSLNFMYIMEMNLIGNVWVVMSVAAFLIKLPMYGFHIWLPKAHVEAPVSGSMILAGILLKLGGYGLYRMLMVLNLSCFYQSLLISVGLVGGLLSAFMCFRQLDMKKLVAYSSVVHMGLFLGGLMTMSYWGMVGGMIMMLSHGLCSSGLFYLVSVIYERIYSRSLLLLKGMLGLNPSLVMWMFLLVVANMAAPPFLSIFGEIYLGLSLIEWEWGLSFILLLMFFLSVGYSVYFYSIIAHGVSNSVLFGKVSVFEFLVLSLHFMPLLLGILKLELFCWL